MKKPILLLSFLTFWVSMMNAQLPVTDVYSFNFKKNVDGKYIFDRPKYLSSHNKKGYNNQPHFIDDKTVYLSTKTRSGNQTDIESLNLYDRKKRKVTKTPDSEYSPTLMPDGNHFSCVRVENDGKETQRLWKFPINRSNNGEVVLSNLKGVGYHCWLNANKVALFIVGEPHRLVIPDIKTQEVIELTSKIGRGMQKLSNGNLAFIQKLGDSSWYIKELNTKTLKTGIIIETLNESEDFIVLSDGTYLMAKGSKVYSFKANQDSDWIEIVDLKNYGINDITRIAFNGKQTLVVVDKKGT